MDDKDILIRRYNQGEFITGLIDGGGQSKLVVGESFVEGTPKDYRKQK